MLWIILQLKSEIKIKHGVEKREYDSGKMNILLERIDKNIWKEKRFEADKYTEK